MVVEGKDQSIWPNGKSPDEMDAVMYANWVRPRTRTQATTPFDQDNRHPGFDPRTKRVADVTVVDRPDHPRVPVTYRMPTYER